MKAPLFTRFTTHTHTLLAVCVSLVALIRMKTDRFLALLCVVSAVTVPLPALAVDPPPVGGYPGENTALGDNALFSLITGTSNSAVGYEALYNTTTGFGNVADGHNALFSSTTGVNNTAVGESALYNTTTNRSTATGAFALFSNTVGGGTADGAFALYSNTSGSANVAVGEYTMYYNTTGTSNTAVGNTAMEYNTTGVNNVAMGAGALFNNDTGFNNTGIGEAALVQNMSGAYNVAVGVNALTYSRRGNYNIALGTYAGFNLKSGDYNIYIGNNAVASESGSIRIGDRRYDTNTYIAGISGVTVAAGAQVVVDTTGHLGTVTSSARFKDNIRPMKDASRAILSLQPVTFRYKKELDSSGVPQFGLVAEEVAKVDPDLVINDESGKPYTVRYEAVNSMLLNEFLKEHRKVEEQAHINRQQAATNEQLKVALAKEEETIKTLAAALKEQRAQVQKIGAQLAAGDPAARLVSSP